jgi:sn-glycerol 3-phosphate transport system ATP-binding protein
LAGGQALVIRAPAATRVQVGERISAGFGADCLHWFDPETTRRIN